MNMSLINKSMWFGAIALTLCASSAFAGGKGIKVGDALPELSTFGLEGKLPDDLKGKVVLLDFWASWCEPCQKELPELEKLHKTLADTGPVVLGVNLDKDRKNALQYVQRLGLTFRMWHDPQGKTAEAYDPPKMPTSYVIDKTGIVRYINEGYHSPDDLRRVSQQIAELNR